MRVFVYVEGLATNFVVVVYACISSAPRPSALPARVALLRRSYFLHFVAVTSSRNARLRGRELTDEFLRTAFVLHTNAFSLHLKSFQHVLRGLLSS